MNFDCKLISYNSKYHTHVTAHQLRDSKDTARHVTAHQLCDSRNRLERGGGDCSDAWMLEFHHTLETPKGLPRKWKNLNLEIETT